MISVEEALSLVLEHAPRNEPVRVPVVESAGLVLAEDIASDIDSPPHDKAMVDGYAVLSSDLEAGSVELNVLEEVTAGNVPRQAITGGSATRIMTGAPIPAGCDAVVMIETCRTIAGDPPRVHIDNQPVRAGQNIMRRGTSLRREQVVLREGTPIRPVEIGLLSEVGRAEISVYRRPAIAVLATGNELVPPDQSPAAGCIRNSNGPMLAAQAAAAGGEPTALGIARDDADDLRRLIAAGLRRDVLVLSGGVSAGVLDLVPGVLAELGVTQVFHKVRLKPGKPLWFGVLQRDERAVPVFGLPGNPVSSFVCFQLLVRPVLDQMAGRPPRGSGRQPARLTEPQAHRGGRPTFFPAVYQRQGSDATARPVPWQGSADLRTLTEANCLICFPPGDRDYAEGERVDVHLF